uniref:K+ potassium transporter integral membrane domain-containing protein n=1 Tax=Aegilops tauschii subsp. strangulata TaxID=200361 RepID=A0A453KQM3_AEGTS
RNPSRTLPPHHCYGPESRLRKPETRTKPNMKRHATPHLAAASLRTSPRSPRIRAAAPGGRGGKMDDGGIQEEEQPPSARPLRPRRSGGSSRWVDASEVDSSESAHWSLEDEREPWALSAADEAEVLCATGGALLSRRSSSAFRRRLGKRPKRADSLDVEAMNVRGAHGHSAQDISLMGTVAMAFQTLGVVYGDMGTSPLYVFSDVFSKVPIKSEVEILGALSLVMYTIALIPFAKYVFIVLKANDNGEG